MPSLSDIMLAAGCAIHVEAIHGEPVVILKTGLTFMAVREIEQDSVLIDQYAGDRRAKIFLRFRDDPGIGQSGLVKTADGKKWRAEILQEAGYLTNDYELIEITDKDQQ